MLDYSTTQNLIESMVSERIVPGVNYAFIKDKQIFTSTIGFASTYPKVTQLSPFAQYDLASLTKVLITENILLKLSHFKILFQSFKTTEFAFFIFSPILVEFAVGLKIVTS